MAQVSLLMSVLVLVISLTSATSFKEQKNFFPIPDPHVGIPPSGSYATPPPHGSGGSYGGTPPSHHGIPSHGGGGGYKNPTPKPTPSDGNCGTPPHKPSTPTRPSHSHSPSHGGGYHHSSPPTYGGGSPSTPVTTTPPTAPTTPITDPGTPSVHTPPTPLGGTCDFWRSHPSLIYGVLGWWGTIGNAFGTTSLPSGFGSTMTLPQALSNTPTDGIGSLYREGTASLLNSMVNTKFPFSTKQVRESFVAALGSNSAAAAQARLFKLANEGHLKPRS